MKVFECSKNQSIKILTLLLLLLSTQLHAGWVVNGEIGIGGVKARSKGIKAFHDADNIDDVWLTGIPEITVYAPGPLGIFLNAAQSGRDASHYQVGLKFRLPFWRCRATAGVGPGLLAISSIDPVTERTQENFHLKTIGGSLGLDFKLTPTIYTGISYYYIAANDPHTEIQSIEFSGSMQAFYFKLGYELPGSSR